MAKLLLIAGQSNAVGRAPIDLGPEWVRGVKPGIFIWNFFNQAWEVLNVGVNNSGKYGANDDVHGPEVTLGLYAQKHYRDDIYIFKQPRGGTGLDLSVFPTGWLSYSGSGLGKEFWDEHDVAKAAMPTPVDASLVYWDQGEADSENATARANYQANLQTWFTDATNGAVVRSGNPNLTIAVRGLAEIEASVYPEWEAIRDAQVAFVQANNGDRDLEPSAIYVDPVGFTPAPDLHLDSESQLKAGAQVYISGYETRASVQHADYTLAGIRTRLKNEFQLDSRDNARIDQIINDAVQELNRYRTEGWPWQHEEITLQTIAPLQTTIATFNDPVSNVQANYLNPKTAFTTLAPLDPAWGPRWMMQLGSPSATAAGNEEYMVIRAYTLIAQSLLWLDSPFLSGDNSSLAVSFVQPYLRLPNECLKVESVHRLGTNYDQVHYRHPTIIEQMRRQNVVANSIEGYYTVVNDPLPNSSPDKVNDPFLFLYPYPVERQNLKVRYIAQDPKLLFDGDSLKMPGMHAHVIYKIAKYLIAMQLKELSTVSLYRADMMSAMEELNAHYDYTTDDTKITQHFRDDDGFIPGPPNLPSWR